MKTFSVLAIAIFASLAGYAQAQHADYAGQQSREIKALSADEMKQYLAGGGMGFARSAELNRYPGPMHVLELGEQLALTPEQRTATEKLMAAHKADARAIGAKFVDAERVLDRLFAGGSASESAVAAQVRAVAALQGEYRLSHLDTHRRMHALLMQEQIHQYVKLRGYAADNADHNKAKPHH